MRFRKKPVVIEAIQYLGGNDKDGYFFAEMKPSWLTEAFDKQPGEIGSVYRRVTGLFIETLEGVMAVSKDDWIIQGVNGELYPCKPDIFAKTYEPA